MKIKCLVVDDEPLARQGIADYIQKTPFLELVAVCDSAIELMEILQSEEADAIFLDIQMPHLTGMDFLRSFSSTKRPHVILTTAYSEHALEGYQHDVLDYLVKPISFKRFLEAANKLKNRLQAKETEQAKNQDFFFIKSNYRLEKIYFDEILWVESQRNYIAIQTKERGVFQTYLSLQQAEEQLPRANFVRIQKSFIVATKAVEAIDGNQIVVGDRKIPISRNNSEQIISHLTSGKLWKKS